ncbi:MAG: restriction endonuclease subunit S [Candidatus Competibacteraceae bacterium]
MVHNLPEASTFESSIVRVRVERSQLLPEFAALFLSSPASYADRRTFIRQVAVSGVSSADISQFLIVVPPIQEQKAIVERFDAVKYRINRELLEVEKRSQQNPPLMDDLLTGRVTALISSETPASIQRTERKSA